jgi:hypothetical protein
MRLKVRRAAAGRELLAVAVLVIVGYGVTGDSGQAFQFTGNLTLSNVPEFPGLAATAQIRFTLSAAALPLVTGTYQTFFRGHPIDSGTMTASYAAPSLSGELTSQDPTIAPCNFNALVSQGPTGIVISGQMDVLSCGGSGSFTVRQA